MSSSLKIAIAQMVSTESLENNFKQIVELLSAVKNSELVVFPENSLFIRENRQNKLPRIALEDAVFRDLQKVIDQKKLTIILGSVPLTEKNHVSNAMICLRPELPAEIIYRKIHLFDVDVEGADQIRESADYVAGSSSEILNFNDWKIGLSICYDLRFSELYLRYAKERVDLILIPSAFLQQTGQAHWHTLIRARAIESQCFVAAPAQAGKRYGHSLVVSPWGEIRAELDQGPGIIELELNKADLQRVRSQIPMHNHRKL